MAYRHPEDRRKKDRERRAARKAAGLCIQCGDEPPKNGGLRGVACLAKARRARIRRQKERFAAGLCTGCAKRPPMDGCINCEPCNRRSKRELTAELRARRSRREARRARTRLAAGLCRRCGNREVDGSRKHCRPCLDVAAQQRIPSRSRDAEKMREWRRRSYLRSRIRKAQLLILFAHLVVEELEREQEQRIVAQRLAARHQDSHEAFRQRWLGTEPL